MKNIFLSLFFIFLSSILFGFDFGVILNQNAYYEDYGETNRENAVTSLVPWFSGHLGGTAEVYISASFNVEYDRGIWSFAPELLRTELSWFFTSGNFRAGRMNYSDPLGFTVSGLLDGGMIAFDTSFGTISAGSWYTGFLYKKRINITMTQKDRESTLSDVEYDNFADSYFAPGRLLAAIEWEHPALFNLIRTRLSLLGQYHFTGEDLNSQYVTAKFSVPAGAFLFDLGGCLGLIQADDESGYKSGIAVAADFRAVWSLPVTFTSWLTLMARYSSGKNGPFNPFLPVTTINQGSLIRAKMSGTTIASLDYLIMFNRIFGTGLTASYFIRNDLTTYTGYPMANPDEGGYLIGSEFSGRIYWKPASDLQVNLGGGIFVPSWGDAAPDTGNIWRIELNLMLSM